MGLSSVWGNIRGFTVTEYVQSRDSGIFRRWWVKVESPYSMGASGVGSLTEGVGTDHVGAEGVGADFVAHCLLLLFSMASRASC